MTGMTPEQEIRAVAIQAAGAFCAPFSPAAQGGEIPNVEALLFVADVFYGYIQGGPTEALRIHATGDKNDQPAVQQVQLREQEAQLPPSGPAPTPPMAPTQPAAPKTPAAPTPPAAPKPPAEPKRENPANVVPMTGRAPGNKGQENKRPVSKGQENFLKKIEETRRQKAERLLRESAVAKAPRHKMDLIKEANEAGVDDFVLDTGDGGMQQLGTYLASL